MIGHEAYWLSRPVPNSHRAERFRRMRGLHGPPYAEPHG